MNCKRIVAIHLLKFFKMSSLIQKLYPLAMVNKYAIKSSGSYKFAETKERMFKISNLFSVRILDDSEYIRIGDSSDGGYVLVNNICDKDVCISIGIGNNISFDKSIASLVSDVYMYDHTIEEPIHHIPNAHFLKKGLAKELKPGFLRLSDCIAKVSTTKEIILKIDIEGDEWGILAEVNEIDLLRCKQIAIEFHHLQQFSINQKYDDIIKTLENLNMNHMLVNIHANNWSNYDVILNSPFPDVVEVTYLRKDLISLPTNAVTSQNLNLNYPNNPKASDISLNFSRNL